jgi:hypothetical protein
MLCSCQTSWTGTLALVHMQWLHPRQCARDRVCALAAGHCDSSHANVSILGCSCCMHANCDAVATRPQVLPATHAAPGKQQLQRPVPQLALCDNDDITVHACCTRRSRRASHLQQCRNHMSERNAMRHVSKRQNAAHGITRIHVARRDKQKATHCSPWHASPQPGRAMGAACPWHALQH